MFPNIKRAPYKDDFHGINVNLQETAGFGHPLHSILPYRNGLWDGLRKWEEESVEENLIVFMRYEKNTDR
jgi:hypothetical protein